MVVTIIWLVAFLLLTKAAFWCSLIWCRKCRKKEESEKAKTENQPWHAGEFVMQVTNKLANLRGWSLKNMQLICRSSKYICTSPQVICFHWLAVQIDKYMTNRIITDTIVLKAGDYQIRKESNWIKHCQKFLASCVGTNRNVIECKEWMTRRQLTVVFKWIRS